MGKQFKEKEVDKMNSVAIILTERNGTERDRISLSVSAVLKRIKNCYKACFARGISMDGERLFV